MESVIFTPQIHSSSASTSTSTSATQAQTKAQVQTETQTQAQNLLTNFYAAERLFRSLNAHHHDFSSKSSSSTLSSSSVSTLSLDVPFPVSEDFTIDGPFDVLVGGGTGAGAEIGNVEGRRNGSGSDVGNINIQSLKGQAAIQQAILQTMGLFDEFDFQPLNVRVVGDGDAEENDSRHRHYQQQQQQHRQESNSNISSDSSGNSNTVTLHISGLLTLTPRTPSSSSTSTSTSTSEKETLTLQTSQTITISRNPSSSNTTTNNIDHITHISLTLKNHEQDSRRISDMLHRARRAADARRVMRVLGERRPRDYVSWLDA